MLHNIIINITETFSFLASTTTTSSYFHSSSSLWQTMSSIFEHETVLHFLLLLLLCGLWFITGCGNNIVCMCLCVPYQIEISILKFIAAQQQCWRVLFLLYFNFTIRTHFAYPDKISAAPRTLSEPISSTILNNFRINCSARHPVGTAIKPCYVHNSGP